jgi:hypothetical protein
MACSHAKCPAYRNRKLRKRGIIISKLGTKDEVIKAYHELMKPSYAPSA